MRKLGVIAIVLLGATASLGLARYGRGQEPVDPLAAKPPVRIDPSAVAVRILLGRGDTRPTPWDGSLEVTDGSLLRVEGWRFRQMDQLTGPASWKASSRRQLPAAGQRANANGPPMTPNGVIATLSGGPQMEVRVTTPRGEFRFKPDQLAPGAPTVLLDGAASAERVYPDFPLTAAGTEDDFPAAAAARDGSVWTAYVAYRYGQPELPFARQLNKEPENFEFLHPKDNGDQVRLARITPASGAAEWKEVAPLTPAGQDVYRPAVAADRDGNVWVAWSQNVGGNWDLYARRWSSGALSRTIRLTRDPGPDLHVALAADEEGTVWMVWQGFRNGNADIWVASAAPGEERWSRPVRVTRGPGNDWDPQVACARDGSVWAAWDTYDRGNYDVMLRRLGTKNPGEAIPVAQTARFEARPSLVCDAQSRVWVAWEDAPEGWGKDFGYVVRNNAPGIPLYRQHKVAVRCFVNGRPYHTTGAIGDVLGGPAQQASFPRLGADREGRICLTFRRPVPEARGPQGTVWYSFLTTYDGAAWTRPRIVSLSDGLLDSRPALVATSQPGLLYMLHSADARNHGAVRDPRFEIYVSPVRMSDMPARDAAAGLAPDQASSAAAPAPAGSEPADLTRIRAYRIRAGGRSYQLMRGDFHRHTEISGDGGGDGPLVDVYRYALDAAGMDWMCAQDHDNGGGREYTWWIIQKLCDAFHVGDSFVPLFGYERSVNYPDGHRNVMFSYRGIRTLPRLSAGPMAGVARGDTPMLYKYLRAFNGICSSHTSATNMGTDWRDNDPQVEPVVEIYQGDRNNYEYLGAPRANSEGDSPGGYQPAGFVWNALGKGYRLGFQSSSDHISTHMSYAVTLVEHTTREAVVDAFKRRHTYAATDNIVLDVRSGSHIMGDEWESREAPRLRIRAVGTGPIARLIVVKENQVVYTATPGQPDVDMTWMDSAPKTGTSYYYVRVEQQDGQLAWGSPMWIRYRP